MLTSLGSHLVLGSLLTHLRDKCGGYRLVDHWQQGEFHHDTVLAVDAVKAALPGQFLVVATNCNGGIKEVLCFNEMPTAGGLWHARCPDSAEFAGTLPTLLGSSRTVHWFDPCDLLRDDARSEYREEFRERQDGGGWKLRTCAVMPRASKI
jgi:hypothetical protein